MMFAFFLLKSFLSTLVANKPDIRWVFLILLRLKSKSVFKIAFEYAAYSFIIKLILILILNM